jgi:NhaP-type Na+/H+ or K+/H+ antiporter
MCCCTHTHVHCNNQRTPRHLGTYFLLPLLWLVLWLATTNQHGLPGGVLFALVSLYALALLFGRLATCCRLPPLLGMLTIGFLMRILSDVTRSTVFVVAPLWSSGLRSVALVVILTRAGLGLDLKNLRRLSWSVLRLACLPNLLEASMDACMAVVVFQMPWLWAFMLGFILSAVSPAVVVPSLLRLKEGKYGTKKGIPDLVLAAASFDDVLSISGFGICLGLSLSDGSSLAWDLLRAPVELIVGIVGGMFLGWVGWYVTPGTRNSGTAQHRGEEERKRDVLVRTALLLLMGCLVVFGGKKVHLTGAGALAVIVMGLT